MKYSRHIGLNLEFHTSWNIISANYVRYSGFYKGVRCAGGNSCLASWCAQCILPAATDYQLGTHYQSAILSCFCLLLWPSRMIVWVKNKPRHMGVMVGSTTMLLPFPLSFLTYNICMLWNCDSHSDDLTQVIYIIWCLCNIESTSFLLTSVVVFLSFGYFVADFCFTMVNHAQTY